MSFVKNRKYLAALGASPLDLHRWDRPLKPCPLPPEIFGWLRHCLTLIRQKYGYKQKETFLRNKNIILFLSQQAFKLRANFRNDDVVGLLQCEQTRHFFEAILIIN